MKSADKVAEELDVSPLEIERRLNPEFTRRFSEHMESRNGHIYFDAEAEEFLKLVFNKNGARDERRPRTADETGRSESSAEAEAALAGTDTQIPVFHWTQLPIVQTISMPLNYRPDILIQAVEAQRQELNEFLQQFDQLVEQIVPSEEWGGRRRGAEKHGARKAIRLVGTSI